MKRLAFRLPEFDPRITWTSNEARAVWEPRMKRVSQAFLVAEREAVIHDVKPAALQAIAPERLPDLTRQMAAYGLVVMPLGKTGRTSGYSSAAPSYTEGQPFEYRVVITWPKDVEAWPAVWDQTDDRAIGRMLGYPSCCRAFFERVWVDEHWMDTTYRMAHGETDVGGTNLLLRWFGIRPVSHLPCRFDCEATARHATAMLALLPLPERAWAIDMLDWPTRWSSLHGIAEIFTPVFRAIVPTDALATVAEIRFHGETYPDEGATGLVFPYRMTAPKVIPRPSLKNGFVTEEAMVAAHDVLLQAIAGKRFKTVIDLGCGDGTLLRKVMATRLVGVEQDAAIRPEGLDRVVYMDCTDHQALAELLAEELPDLVIAQRDRNPPDPWVFACQVLSYSYEGGTTAQLMRGRVAV